MRIVLDLQGLQSSTNEEERRHILSVSKAICKNIGCHEVLIILSSVFTDSIEIIRREFDGIINQENILIFYVPSKISYLSGVLEARKSANILREAFISNLKADIVYIFSFFGSLKNGTTMSAGYFNDILVCVDLYDATPSAILQIARNDEISELWHQDKIKQLKKANVFFTISDDVKSEWLKSYPSFNDKVFNISSREGIFQDTVNDIEPRRNGNDKKTHDYLTGEVILDAIVDETGGHIDELQIKEIVKCLSDNMLSIKKEKTLFIDISKIIDHDLHTGIQRVTRSILKQLSANNPTGYKVEAVYATTYSKGYRYAKRFMTKFMGLNEPCGEDSLIEAAPCDIFLGLDLCHDVIDFQLDYLKYQRDKGVKFYFVVHDILPITMPDKFPKTTDIAFEKWLKNISQFDGIICGSETVVHEVTDWQDKNHIKRKPSYVTGYFHHSGDIDDSMPTEGLPKNADIIIEKIKKNITILSVSTVEPRKGYGEALSTMEKLWDCGYNVNYVIVGKKGWDVDSLCKKLENHKELGNRLFWLQGISDEYLNKIYASSTVLLIPSLGEGFGLSIVEAARYQKPIIARDIKIFREIAGNYAFYFKENLDTSIKEWVELYRKNEHPKTNCMKLLTWKDSAEMLLKNIV